jgi:hypothetical protein
MNFIAFDAAYCLYPKATFDERRALSFSSLTEHDLKALGKYAVRGWSLLANIWPHETKTSRTSFYLERKRWVKDNLSWVVPLDMTGVQPRARVSLLSERFPWDPVVCNSWILSKSLPSSSNKVFVHYTMLKTTVFRYAYVIADADLIQSMMDFIQEQGALEHQKTHHFPESRNADSWTWCVRALFISLICVTEVTSGGMRVSLGSSMRICRRLETSTRWIQHESREGPFVQNKIQG